MTDTSLRRRVVAVALWVAATLGATLLSWAGTSLVRAEVTTAHPYLSREDVLALTRTAERAPEPTPRTTPVEKPASPPATPRTKATSPSVEVAAVRATFASRGGVIAVVCRGSRIRLAGARPNDGYRLQVRDNGPDRVVVSFESRYRRSVIAAVCREGRPVAQRFDDGSRDRDGGRHDGPGSSPSDGSRDGFDGYDGYGG